MYLFVQTKLVIEWGTFALTIISVCAVVFGSIWNFNRARKKDFNEAMDKKADAKEVNEKFNTHAERIKNVRQSLESHEKNNDSQFLSLKELMAEYHATQNHMSDRIDKIWEKVK